MPDQLSFFGPTATMPMPEPIAPPRPSDPDATLYTCPSCGAPIVRHAPVSFRDICTSCGNSHTVWQRCENCFGSGIVGRYDKAGYQLPGTEPCFVCKGRGYITPMGEPDVYAGPPIVPN